MLFTDRAIDGSALSTLCAGRRQKYLVTDAHPASDFSSGGIIEGFLGGVSTQRFTEFAKYGVNQQGDPAADDKQGQ
jgi:hypothetical protein